jgi:hypothetical protein
MQLEIRYLFSVHIVACPTRHDVSDTWAMVIDSARLGCTVFHVGALANPELAKLEGEHFRAHLLGGSSPPEPGDLDAPPIELERYPRESWTLKPIRRAGAAEISGWPRVLELDEVRWALTLPRSLTGL